jgi:hypothetical protein
MLQVTKMIRQRIRLCALLMIGSWAFAGCSGEPNVPIGTLSGTVTLDGKPVPEATINFIKPSGFAASTEIKDGAYEIADSQYGGGLPAGDYLVSIAPVVTMEADPLAKSKTKSPLEAKIPVKYRDPGTSGLTAEVSEEATKANFRLSSQ